MKLMKFIPIFILLLLWSCPAISETPPPQVGSELPGILLTTPQDKKDVDYLGLAGKATFQIPQIRARLVIIEIFSMY